MGGFAHSYPILQLMSATRTNLVTCRSDVIGRLSGSAAARSSSAQRQTLGAESWISASGNRLPGADTPDSAAGTTSWAAERATGETGRLARWWGASGSTTEGAAPGRIVVPRPVRAGGDRRWRSGRRSWLGWTGPTAGGA